MAAKIPLNDHDRYPWLQRLSHVAISELDYKDNVVVACSALKLIYRNVFRQAVQDCQHMLVTLHFLYLKLDEESVASRLVSRKGHFMPAALVKSQFEALEEPTDEEVGLDCIVLNSGDSPGNLKVIAEAAVMTYVG